MIDLRFAGDVFEWRGPAPFYFVAVAEDAADVIHELSSLITYGWGVIPVTATVDTTEWTTSLFPKDGGYLLPLKADIRRTVGIDVGDTVDVTLSLDVDP